MELYILVGAALIVFGIFFVSTYKVVNPNEAHVVVFMGRGRKIYSPANGEKTSYFFIPLLMKRFALPLTNIKLDINNIALKDVNVAPFICDVITWVHIGDPVKAVERLDLTHSGGVFVSLHADLINIVQAVARAAAMKQEILEILRDRQTFSQSVSKEVDGVLDSWGIQLVNLEVNDIRDSEKSFVIANYESMRQAQVESIARIEVAQRQREAVEAEQDNKQKAEVATAVAQETFIQRQILKDKTIGIRNQEMELDIAIAEETANKQKIEAHRAMEVGKAQVQNQAMVEIATGEANALQIKGEREAQVIKLKGLGEGAAIEAKGTAEATAKDRMASAMQKFNDAATNVEKIRAWIEVQKSKYEALGKALSSADLKLVSSGKGGSLFGFDLNAETGADIGQMIEAFGKEDARNVLEGVVEKIKELKK